MVRPYCHYVSTEGKTQCLHNNSFDIKDLHCVITKVINALQNNFFPYEIIPSLSKI